MRVRWLLLLALLAVRCPAGTIVSTQSSVTLDPGDALEFTVGGVNFTRFTGHADASRVTFAFNTALPAGSSSLFDASLQSNDGSLSVFFGGALAFLTGQMRSPRYSGPVSTLTASLNLTAEQAAALFGPSGNRSVLLVLRNEGAPVTVGIPNYTLLQTGTVSLSSGPVSVGASVSRAYLDEAPAVAMGDALVLNDNQPTATPEPGSMALLALGLLAGAGLLVRGRAKKAVKPGQLGSI
jgi:hypothetical protein